MTEYSNPRREVIVEDWPSGKRRVTAKFYVESDPKRGERAVRQTGVAEITPGVVGLSRPKKLTYAARVRIVDGDDGRIYVAHLTAFGSISVMRGTFDVQHEWVSDRDPRRVELLRLFE